MKPSHVVSFVCGVAMVLGISIVSRSHADTPQHVYELRLYHVNEGKLDALKCFGDHTDSIFKRHNIMSFGYW